jgi:hypothetical protein
VKNGLIISAEESKWLYETGRPFLMDILRHTVFTFDQYFQLPDDIRRDSSLGMAILKTNKFDKDTLAPAFPKTFLTTLLVSTLTSS